MIGKLESAEDTLPSGGETPPFALPGWSILALEGPDALAFAQAQLMNDLDRLSDGQWQWSGWLSPRGRVIALCIALRRDARTLWLLLPDLPAGDLSTALQRYVFRSKLALRELADWQVAGRFLTSSEPADCLVREADDGHLILHFGSTGDDDQDQRRLLLLPPGATPSRARQETADRWRICDLRAGLPHLDADQREQYTPQMLALERLRAYSVKKGCYPGQEIVSRTHYLGRARRRLCRLGLPPDPGHRPGDPLADADGRQLTTLLNVVSSAAGNEALAVLDEDSAACIDNVALARLPLLDCLPH